MIVDNIKSLLNEVSTEFLIIIVCSVRKISVCICFQNTLRLLLCLSALS